MKTQGKVIPKWLSKHVDTIENLIFLGNLQHFWKRLIDAADIDGHEQMLDIGCGSGELTHLISKLLDKGGHITGLDASEGMIELCNRNPAFSDRSLSFQTGIMEGLEFPDQYFDIIISSLALHHVPKDAKQKALKEMHRVLKTGGRLLLLDHGKPYNLFTKILMFPNRWNIIEYQAENFRGEIPGMIRSAFGNVAEVDRFYGWIRIWKAVKKDPGHEDRGWDLGGFNPNGMKA